MDEEAAGTSSIVVKCEPFSDGYCDTEEALSDAKANATRVTVSSWRTATKSSSLSSVPSCGINPWRNSRAGMKRRKLGWRSPKTWMQIGTDYQPTSTRKEVFGRQDVPALREFGPEIIQLVELHPVLWDQSLEEFKDRDEKEKAWKEVAMAMDENWDELSENVQKESIASVKKQWKHIRDAFMRSTRPPKPGEPVSKKKKYIYSDALTFLTNSLEKRRTSGNFDEAETQSQESCQVAHEVEAEEDEFHRNGDGSAAFSSQPAKLRRQPGGKPVATFQSFPLEKHGESQEDADCKFLLSLHPKMARLTESQKLDFQLHCLMFFRDLHKQQNQCPSCDSPSSSTTNSYPSGKQHQQRRPHHVPNSSTISPLPVASPSSSSSES